MSVARIDSEAAEVFNSERLRTASVQLTSRIIASDEDVWFDKNHRR